MPYREGGYWYYARTEEGKQYPILCRRRDPMARRRSRSTRTRWPRACLLLARRVRGERRRPLPRLFHRRHRLPRVHAVREGPPDGRAAAVQGREGGLGGVGGGRPDAVLHRRRPGQAVRTACTATSSARRRTRWSRGAGRAVPGLRGRTRSRQYLLLACASHTTTEWRFAPAAEPGRRVAAGRAPRARARIRRRPPRRLVLHPHQRPRPQLPPGEGAGGAARGARAGRRSCPIARR